MSHASHLAPTSSLSADGGSNDGAPPPIDYAPLREAAHAALAWLRNLACNATCDPDDVAAIDRVMRSVGAAIDGVPMCCRPAALRASHQDHLITLGILIERFEVDFRAPGLSQLFAAFYESVDWSEPPPAPTGRASGHALHRHSDLPAIVRQLAAGLTRAPRLAHGPGEAPTARVIVLPLR